MLFNELSVLVLVTARCPEDVFFGAQSLAEMNKLLRKMSAVAHPDANPNNTQDAGVVFQRVTTWGERAKAKFKSGTWGDRKPAAEFNFSTGAGNYEVYGLNRRDALFDALDASLDGRPVALHVARQRKHELRVLEAVAAMRAVSGVGVPRVIETVELTGRVAYATEAPPKGLIPLQHVMARMRDGIPLGNMFAYLTSLLVLIDRAAKQSWAHTSINPGTWWIDPNTNASYLVDWHYACRIGDIAAHRNTTYEEFCSWEVFDGAALDRGSDIASAMKVLREAIGTQHTPEALDLLISTHLREGRARPSDAPQCANNIREIYTRLNKTK